MHSMVHPEEKTKKDFERKTFLSLVLVALKGCFAPPTPFGHAVSNALLRNNTKHFKQSSRYRYTNRNRDGSDGSDCMIDFPRAIVASFGFRKSNVAIQSEQVVSESKFVRWGRQTEPLGIQQLTSKSKIAIRAFRARFSILEIQERHPEDLTHIAGHLMCLLFCERVLPKTRQELQTSNELQNTILRPSKQQKERESNKL